MDTIHKIVKIQREYFNTGITKETDFRIKQLKILRNAIKDKEDAIMEALYLDLNKTPFEAYETEIGIILEQISYAIKNLPKWVKTKRVHTPITLFPATSYLYEEPYGVSLIISPWNYPFHLAPSPLIGAIAAGNCAVVKPSEYSKHTAQIIEEIITEIYEEQYIMVIRGGREANKTLLQEKFDCIFFTGSVSVGRTVMEAAAKNLTPVTLELGGKSPCIIDETADINMAAKKIVWGKFLNAGQTCIAPDYILVQRSVKDKLVHSMQRYCHKFYGDDPCHNTEYPKIINEKHFDRLLPLMKSGTVIYGGNINEETRQIAPTLLDKVSFDSEIMKEEIFGPILPILEFERMKEVVDLINQRPKPLALYYFSNVKQRQQFILKHISFGGGCINDTIIHLANSHLPFGGVGDSGMGSYHGKASFQNFSHTKSIIKGSNYLDIPIKYPPHKNNLAILKQLLR